MRVRGGLERDKRRVIDLAREPKVSEGMPHTSTCDCGQLTLTYEGEIKRTSICHCLACQKRTGSVFGAQAKLEKARTTIAGKSTAYRRTGDDPADGHVEFHFCPSCGSTVFWHLSGMPDSIIAAVGCFADRALPAPVFSVYETRKHPWVTLPSSVTEHWD